MHRGKTATSEDYEKSLNKIASFDTVESFWGVYSRVFPPHDLPQKCDILLFRSSVRPLWEDDNNKLGGRWVLRLPKGAATRVWEDLVLALIGEQFPDPAQVCGCVISLRFQEDLLNLWTRSTDRKAILPIRDRLLSTLQLALDAPLEFKPHDTSQRDAQAREAATAAREVATREAMVTGGGGEAESDASGSTTTTTATATTTATSTTQHSAGTTHRTGAGGRSGRSAQTTGGVDPTANNELPSLSDFADHSAFEGLEQE